MEVFDFMVSIKERLQDTTPSAIVTVEPHNRESVSIKFEWKVGQWYGIQRIVSVKEIAQRNGNIIDYYVTLFEHLKADAISTERQG